jgi:malonyl-CoA decarboxylase
MSEQAGAGIGFLGRTRHVILSTWREVLGKTRFALKGALRPDLPDEDLERLRGQVDSCLTARGGEASARARAADLGAAYLNLSDAGRTRFLALLANDYGVDRKAVAEAAAELPRAGTDEAYDAGLRRLRDALTPPRVTLLRQVD